MTPFDGSQVLILGLGNDFRRDDGVGRRAARLLAETPCPGVIVREGSGEGAALMEAWKNADAVILMDAVDAGEEPGTILRFDAQTQRIPARFFHCSTHAFSIPEAMELARAMGTLPRRLVLFGVQGGDFTSGEHLSPEVAAAMPELMARVRQEAGAVMDATRGRETT